MKINRPFSSWQIVTNEAPHGLVLGLQLFIIYVNYLSEQTKFLVSRFAADNKLWDCEHKGECTTLQGDMDKLSEWREQVNH